MPNQDPAATVLGDAQWEWLEAELAKPADLRIVVTSIQLISTAHGWEAWYEMPLERQKMLDLLGSRAESGLVVLSGDRHAGGIYQLAQGDETITEVTSSSLNVSYSTTAQSTAREPDADRITDLIGEENFGLVDIDWAARELTFTLLGNKGQTHAQRVVKW
jgi:alkaline phosphatase D